jgi:hypothetical protein
MNPIIPSRAARWLRGLTSGQTDAVEENAKVDELHARLRRGKEMLRGGKEAEALREFTWLWEHALEVDPSWQGVRYGYLAAALPLLLANHRKAREGFERLRDAVGTDLTDRRALDEWVSLNQILGEASRVIDWLRTVSPTTATVLHLGRNRAIRDIVRDRNAWDVLGQRLEDAVQLLRDQHALSIRFRKGLSTHTAASDEQIDVMGQASANDLRDLASALTRSLLVVGRKSEALAVIAEAKRLDPSPEMRAALMEKDAPVPGHDPRTKRRSSVSKTKVRKKN